MAVKVPEGESEIRFNYLTPGLLSGIQITTIASVVYIIYAIIFVIYHSKRSSVTKYAEGEKLLKEWKQQTLDELAEQTAEEAPKKRNIWGNDENSDLPQNTTYNGGFKINTDAFNEDNK